MAFDWIEQFVALTEGERSPELFRRWAAIGAVAGALERRVWMKNGPRVTYPNMYIMLVGATGAGKGIINLIREIWTGTLEPNSKIHAFRVSPDNMTKASLLDTLAKSKQSRLLHSGPPFEYHSLLIAAEEFGSFLPDYDQAYIHTLNSIYNCSQVYAENRRTGHVKELSIDRPLLHIIGGAQPSYLAATFPDEAWKSGIARRLLMVYSSDKVVQDIFFEPEAAEGAWQALSARLGKYSQLFGEAPWAAEARDEIREWDLAGCHPIPDHSRLESYLSGRTMQVIKLALTSAISRSDGLRLPTIELSDLHRAFDWLFIIEAKMPGIFRAMTGKNDQEVLEELHIFAITHWAKMGRQPLHKSLLLHFLAGRSTHDKVGKILQLAVDTNMFSLVVGTECYLPRPRQYWGIDEATMGPKTIDGKVVQLKG